MLALILLAIITIALISAAVAFGLLELAIKVMALIALIFICDFLFLGMLGLILKATKEDKADEISKN